MGENKKLLQNYCS